MIAPEREAGATAVRRYRPSRSWPVGGLALVAAAGAILATGTISSAMEGGPEPASTAAIAGSAASVRPESKASAAPPAAPPPSSAPSPAGVWQVQIGAFRSVSAAEAHLRALESDLPELARLTASRQPRGDFNRVRIVGIGDEPAARGLCDRIKAAGRRCFVVRPAG